MSTKGPENALEALSIETDFLDEVSVNEVVVELSKGLKESFGCVMVDVVDCPDLQEWGMAMSGIGGRNAIVDVGGFPYLLGRLQNPELNVDFDLIRIMNLAGKRTAYLIGAAAYLPTDNPDYNVAEVCVNMAVNETGRIVNLNNFGAIVSEDGEDWMEVFEGQGSSGSYISALGNLYLSEGAAGEVIKLKLADPFEKARVAGKDFVNFAEVVREVLEVGGRKLALGGVFKVEGGRTKNHVVDRLPAGGISPSEVYDYVRFFDLNESMVGVTSITTGGVRPTPLRTHSHAWTEDRSFAGHYWGSIDDDAEVTAYLLPTDKILKVGLLDFEG